MVDINLQKMKRNDTLDISPIILDLRKKGPVEFRIGLSWDFKPGLDSDLDVTAILLHYDDKIHNNDEIIFYNNLAYPHQDCEPYKTKNWQILQYIIRPMKEPGLLRETMSTLIYVLT